MSQNNLDNGEICIAIDPMGINSLLIGIAVLLAEKLKTGIYGLFVGNDSLQNVAQLPFATEIHLATGDERVLAADSLRALYQKNIERTKLLVAHSAAARQVGLRFDISDGQISLDVVLEHQTVFFMPAPARRYSTGAKPHTGQPGSVKWVYDGSEASMRSFELIKALIAENIVHKVFLAGKSAVPTNVFTELAAQGARVFWMSLTGDDVSACLRAYPEVDLIVVPRTVSAQIGEKQLMAINRATSAAVLVVC